MQQQLNSCINNFGYAPREFSLWDRLTYLRIPRPAWLHASPSDQLMTLFRNLRTLYAEGTVVWGHIIQANQLMFRPGRASCPGELVYSLDDKCEPEQLREVAQLLYALKGTHPTDPELQPIAAYLTDEMVRVFGLQVPRCISPMLSCQISTTFFVRRHLPHRRLCSSILPIVVNPTEPHVAMPLPERYWPQEFKEGWAR